VNKERARNGEAKDEVRNEARARGIKGGSRMPKAQLEKILSR
jgi:hypothetical protein